MIDKAEFKNARAWLWRARNIDEEMRGLKASRDKVFEDLTSITSSYDKLAVQSSPDPHKFDGFVALLDQIAQQENRLQWIKAEILAVINSLEDDRFRRVLNFRFIAGETIEATAAKVGYSYKHTKRLQARGIEAVAEILKSGDYHVPMNRV